MRSREDPASCRHPEPRPRPGPATEPLLSYRSFCFFWLPHILTWELLHGWRIRFMGLECGTQQQMTHTVRLHCATCSFPHLTLESIALGYLHPLSCHNKLPQLGASRTSPSHCPRTGSSKERCQPCEVLARALPDREAVFHGILTWVERNNLPYVSFYGDSDPTQEASIRMN